MVAGGKPDRKAGAAPGMKPQISSAPWKGAQMHRAPSGARGSFKDIRFRGPRPLSAVLPPATLHSALRAGRIDAAISKSDSVERVLDCTKWESKVNREVCAIFRRRFQLLAQGAG